VQKQIRPDYSIKDPILLKMLHPVLDEYRAMISELGPKIELYDADRLVNYLTKTDVITADEINVIAFANKKIGELKEKVGQRGQYDHRSKWIGGLFQNRRHCDYRYPGENAD
jgi:hypothetical protein